MLKCACMCWKEYNFPFSRWCQGPSNPFYVFIQKHKTNTIVKIQTNTQIKSKIKEASTITKKQPCFSSSSLGSSFHQQRPNGSGRRVGSLKVLTYFQISFRPLHSSRLWPARGNQDPSKSGLRDGHLCRPHWQKHGRGKSSSKFFFSIHEHQPFQKPK